MLAVPEKITWALENHNSSVIIISNIENNTENIKTRFQEILKSLWDEAYDEVLNENDIENEEEAIEDGELPCGREESFPLMALEERTIDGKNCIVTEFNELYIPFCYGDFCEVSRACDAVINSFKKLKEEFPEISYTGVITFPWSDRRCGEAECFEVFDDKDNPNKVETINRIMGKILTNAVNGKSYTGIPVEVDEEFSFLEQLKEELTDFEYEEFEEVAMYINAIRNYIGKEELNAIADVCIEVAESLGNPKEQDMANEALSALKK